MNETWETIRDELGHLGREHCARVLVAAESGSRAWGFESPDSDFDVRFIYARDLSHYLRLDGTRDVIEWRLDGVFDISGWDLTKALRLMRGSNPSLFEWLASPIVYTEDPVFAAVRDVAPRCFCPVSGIHHYLSMARSSRAALTAADGVSLKKYLYTTRALLAARWISRELTPTPMLMSELVEAVLEDSMRGLLAGLLEEKAGAGEHTSRARIPKLDGWFDVTTAELEARVKELTPSPKVPWEELNTIFREVVIA